MVLRWSAYIHPRLNYAAFVAVAEEIRRGGLARNGFQKKNPSILKTTVFDFVYYSFFLAFP